MYFISIMSYKNYCKAIPWDYGKEARSSGKAEVRPRVKEGYGHQHSPESSRGKGAQRAREDQSDARWVSSLTSDDHEDCNCPTPCVEGSPKEVAKIKDFTVRHKRRFVVYVELIPLCIELS
jgi:hypothetical protein